jgi:hypothetical protein
MAKHGRCKPSWWATHCGPEGSRQKKWPRRTGPSLTWRFRHERAVPARKSTSLNVICNDIFAWGCSDAETISYDDIQGVYDAWIANRLWGPAKWCAIKRNLKPQAPVIEAMKKAGVWDESMDALSTYRHSPPKPIDVCPHCKRPLLSIVGRYGFCKEHHEVVPMRSAVSNDYEEPDWSAA